LRNIYGHFNLFANIRGDIDNILIVWGDIVNWVVIEVKNMDFTHKKTSWDGGRWVKRGHIVFILY
jgi:hypothetical protein